MSFRDSPFVCGDTSISAWCKNLRALDSRHPAAEEEEVEAKKAKHENGTNGAAKDAAEGANGDAEEAADAEEEEEGDEEEDLDGEEEEDLDGEEGEEDLDEEAEGEEGEGQYSGINTSGMPNAGIFHHFVFCSVLFS